MQHSKSFENMKDKTMLALPRLMEIRFGRVSPHLRRLAALRRQRNALSHLEDYMLDDIGVSRREAESEAERPIWDVPTSWRY